MSRLGALVARVWVDHPAPRRIRKLAFTWRDCPGTWDPGANACGYAKDLCPVHRGAAG